MATNTTATTTAAGPPLRPPTPCVKWAGGKRQIAGVLVPHVQRMLAAAAAAGTGTGAGARLVVPFTGGGGLLLSVLPDRVWINDTNPGLVNMYRQVRDSVEAVLACLRTKVNTKEDFYREREEQRGRAADGVPPSTPEHAAQLLYLNRTCFRGLYRENRKGQFNVPYGNYRNDSYKSEAFHRNLRALSAYLRRAAPGAGDITCLDFRAVLARVGRDRGDVVYADPPYYPLKKDQFVGYGKHPFKPTDHDALNALLRDADVAFVLSNSPAPPVREFWEAQDGCSVSSFWVNRRVTVYRPAAGDAARDDNELLVVRD